MVSVSWFARADLLAASPLLVPGGAAVVAMLAAAFRQVPVTLQRGRHAGNHAGADSFAPERTPRWAEALRERVARLR